MMKSIGHALCFTGFAICICAIGCMEQERYAMAPCLLWSVIGLVGMAYGAKLAGLYWGQGGGEVGGSAAIHTEGSKKRRQPSNAL